MIIYLPCKLGEEFTVKRFIDWQDGKRVYEDGKTATLTGFDAFDCQTRCLSIPSIHTNIAGFLSYDPEGQFSQEFEPKYKISLDIKTMQKLCELGFPSNRTARLCGIVMKEGQLYADFVTSDRYEHLRYPIADNIVYCGMEEEVVETKLILQKL